MKNKLSFIMNFKFIFTTLVILTIVSKYDTYSQINRTLQNRINPATISKLQWYSNNLRKFDPKVFNAQGKVIHSLNNQFGGKTEIVENFAPKKDIKENGSSTSIIQGGQVCDKQPMSMDYLQQEVFNIYGFIPNTIYPGSFINVNTLLNKTPESYTAANSKRVPYAVRIDISNPSTSAPTSTSIASDFSSNNTEQLNRELRNRHFNASVPANIIGSITEIKSEVEARAKLDVSLGLMLPLEEFGIPAEISQGVRGSINVSTTKKIRKYMMNFIQPMYSYRMNQNDRDALFNAPGEASKHQNAAMVETVVYGRRLLIVIESEADEQTVKGTISQRLGISITGGDLANAQLGSKVDAQADAKFKNEIKSFQAVVYGGNSRLGSSMMTSPDAVVAWLADPNSAVLNANTNALPIQYVVQKVSTGSVMIGTRSTANYTNEECVEPAYKVEVQYLGIKCYKVVEGLGDDKEDIFGTCTVSSKSLINIPENAAVSIKQGATARDSKKVTTHEHITLAALKDLVLELKCDLKDWEPLHKPQYRPKQPMDVKLEVGTSSRLSQYQTISQGQSITLDNKNHEARIYENGDSNGSSIAVIYKVIITRK
ncbi:hypothetical protein MASR1M45_04130 [Candidatus Kapaibacterium sp.]